MPERHVVEIKRVPGEAARSLGVCHICDCVVESDDLHLEIGNLLVCETCEDSVEELLGELDIRIRYI